MLLSGGFSSAHAMSTRERNAAGVGVGRAVWVRNQLIARGMESFGWACAWRSLCWARLKDAEKAYQLILGVLRPSVDNSNGSALNLVDMYSFGDRAIFQIDANFGAPTAMLEMLLYSRPGVIELLPALPAAWARSGAAGGVGARGGFSVDLTWRDGKVSSATVHSVRGGRTTVTAGSWHRTVTVPPRGSVTTTSRSVRSWRPGSGPLRRTGPARRRRRPAARRPAARRSRRRRPGPRSCRRPRRR